MWVIIQPIKLTENTLKSCHTQWVIVWTCFPFPRLTLCACSALCTDNPHSALLRSWSACHVDYSNKHPSMTVDVLMLASSTSHVFARKHSCKGPPSCWYASWVNSPIQDQSLWLSMLYIQQLLTGAFLTISTGRVNCNPLSEISATFVMEIRNLWQESRNCKIRTCTLTLNASHNNTILGTPVCKIIIAVYAPAAFCKIPLLN